tara:strand:+ start:6447 stop:6896 length:450 start_codon:yes stop_codon:yes gene_type:complete
MTVEVQLATAADTPGAADIEGWARAALTRATGSDDGEVCVRVVDAGEIRELNATYRGKDAPTNVLSFPADVELPETRIWGDVVVCAPVVDQEAADQGKAYADHFAHMVVHGVLHLLGYDHETAAEADVMERLEIEILGRFGVGDPYGEG